MDRTAPLMHTDTRSDENETLTGPIATPSIISTSMVEALRTVQPATSWGIA